MTYHLQTKANKALMASRPQPLNHPNNSTQTRGWHSATFGQKIMKTKLLWFTFLLHPFMLGSCSTTPQAKQPSSILTFHPADGVATELGVVSVKKGVDRGSVEWHLVADKVGEEFVTNQMEKQFGMKRIHSDQDMETILRTEFEGISGKDSARALWNRYRSGTFSGLECGNATIIFFDSNSQAVEAWPLLENVTKTEQDSGSNALEPHSHPSTAPTKSRVTP